MIFFSNFFDYLGDNWFKNARENNFYNYKYRTRQSHNNSIVGKAVELSSVKCLVRSGKKKKGRDLSLDLVNVGSSIQNYLLYIVGVFVVVGWIQQLMDSLCVLSHCVVFRSVRFSALSLSPEGQHGGEELSRLASRPRINKCST